MSWLWLISTALGGVFSPQPVTVQLDTDDWRGSWSLDGEQHAPGSAEVALLPGTHSIRVGGRAYPFTVYLDGSIGEDEAALHSEARHHLALETVPLQVNTEASWRLAEAEPALDGTLAVVPGAFYTLELGHLGDPLYVHVAPDGTVETTLTAAQATTGPHRLDILTKKVKTEPQGYSGLWWTSADPRTAQYGATTLEVVPALPYGIAAGLRDRFAFAFRVSLTGSAEILGTRGHGRADAGRTWVRFSVGGAADGPTYRSLHDALLAAPQMQPPVQNPEFPDYLGEGPTVPDPLP